MEKFEIQQKVNKTIDDLNLRTTRKAFIKGIPYIAIGVIVCPLILFLTITVCLKPHPLLAMFILFVVLAGFVIYMSWILNIMAKRVLSKWDWGKEKENWKWLDELK
jgi:type IV secretory pathway VirB3-like protein